MAIFLDPKDMPQSDDQRPKIRLFSRLEGRPRQEDFTPSLRAEIHDALWMLTRQWQFGEFQGEDAGTAIEVDIELELFPLTDFSPQSNGDRAYPFNDEIPLEARVEAESVPFDLKRYLQVSNYWHKLLLQEGCSGKVIDNFFVSYPLQEPTDSQVLDHWKSDTVSWMIFQTYKKKLLDGKRLIRDMETTESPASLITPNNEGAKINAAAQKLLSWYHSLHLASNGPSTWETSRLEYHYSQRGTVRDDEGNIKDALLTAKEYYNGRLDWYQCDLGLTSKKTVGKNKVEAKPAKHELTAPMISKKTMIPTPLRFSGMPASRWWEFENSRVNLARLDAQIDDFSKLLVTEFALVYSNDWQIVPLTVPYNSLSRVKAIKVKDVFGKTITINAFPIPTNVDELNVWNVFSLHPIAGNTTNASVLYTPSVIPDLLESLPVEAVSFRRDEWNNIVWAIEEIVPSALGKGMPGKTGQPLVSQEDHEENAAGQLKYIPQERIMEYAIPFIPVRAASEDNNIVFQRGKLQRQATDTPGDILPKGVLLTEVATPYFICEEEVPAVGFSIVRSFQRTRWHNGKVVTWLGRRKQYGTKQTILPTFYFDKISWK
jgi:hypothetical protein